LTSPRPYVAAAAAAVLAALYFVPSATASTTHDTHAPSAARAATVARASSSQHLGLADTGGVDTKPYMIGGAAFLVAGAGLVVNAGRRSRQQAL
jgi:hypothetical protein